MDRPTKSILKKTQAVDVLSLVQETETSQREETPEPSLPQYDAMYLETPVRVITDPASSLKELCAAYSTLAARLRACVDDADKPDFAWPLFKPLHAHSIPLMESITRDVGRALVDPAPETEAKVSLPSPQKSPRKKRGMSAQQVKHARDLCSTTHCVLKLLAFVFTQPAIYEIFSGKSVPMPHIALPLTITTRRRPAWSPDGNPSHTPSGLPSDTLCQEDMRFDHLGPSNTASITGHSTTSR